MLCGAIVGTIRGPVPPSHIRLSGGYGTGGRSWLLVSARPPRSAPCYSFMAEQAGSQ